MYDLLTSWNNLLTAYHKAAKGKRGQPNVAAFEYHLEDNLSQLQRSLRRQTYQPSGYANFLIHDPKTRLISAAPFRDRVVHHALCNIIEPLFERLFIPDSYANRAGKGTHRALDRCQQWARRYRYVLQCDIRQFFPSIDHAHLIAILQRRINDRRVNWLCGQIIDSGAGVLRDKYEMVYFTHDNLLAALRPRGLPIGNLTSQFWANVYMNPFDQFTKRTLRVKGYLRFVDDFLLFSDDKEILWRWKTAIENRLASLRIVIHPHAHPQPVSEGIPFLGFVIYPNRRRLKRRQGVRYRRRLSKQLRQYEQGLVNFDQVDASVKGWVNHVRYANTIGLRKAILRNHVVHAPQVVYDVSY